MRRMGLFMGILLLLLAPLGCAGPEYWRGKELPDPEILEGSRRFESRTHSIMVDSEALELESILRIQSNCERVDGRMLLRPFFRIKLRQLAWAEGKLWGYSVRYGVQNAQTYDAHGRLVGVSQGLPVDCYHSRKLENDRWLTLPSLSHPYYSDEYSGRPANAVFFIEYLAIYQRPNHMPEILVFRLTSPLT